MRKIMVLTDSDGYPRSFPPSEVFALEETWPYLLRSHFKGAMFWQLSFGNITTMKLVSQPMGYLTHWQPDIIIVQSGIADCRPEAFTDFQKEIISKLTWKFFGRIKKYVNHPGLIKRRQVYRVSKGGFRAAIRKFKLVFPLSKIFWLEIGVGPSFDKSHPGIELRMEEFNAIIKGVYGDDFVPVREKILEADGYNALDHGHQNKRGHQVVADVLIRKIETCSFTAG
ncbi:MAG: SGNH/GDSL hydrolase family protein [Candidatus Omnitrophica bacterium]|nr:SGNH/GDSL hydrolase family protein [Candidatus Omnitrophota bacterium]